MVAFSVGVWNRVKVRGDGVLTRLGPPSSDQRSRPTTTTVVAKTMSARIQYGRRIRRGRHDIRVSQIPERESAGLATTCRVLQTE